jgi:CheY-like chemotaxis protein
LARTVLLADDSVTAQNMGRRILTDAGYEVITVNNGSAALKKIHESRPDLIVLDVYMPGYGGLEVCQRLKESDATVKIPVLLTVGKMEPFKTEEAKRVRADGHIVKPFDASELLAALAKLEDKIVPKSEGWRLRGKSESKKTKARGHDPAADFDDSQTEQISHLKKEKSRDTTVSAQEVPAEAASASNAAAAAQTKNEEFSSIRPADPFAGRDSQIPTSIEEAPAEPVTFAAGPIFDSNAQAVAEPEKAPQESKTYSDSSRETQPAVETISESVASGSSEATEPVTTAASEFQAPPPVTAPENNAADSEPWPAARVESAPRWIAETVTVSADEASRSLDEEMRQAQGAGESTIEERTAQEATLEASQPYAISPVPESDAQSGAAFAAAASASDSGWRPDAISNPASSDSNENSEPDVALENWQRIRDSVLTQKATEAIAESVAQIAATTSEEPVQSFAVEAPNEPAADATPQTGASGDALSSIVDNVLAELKPRLLAEIAKQLAGDKK